MGIIGAKLASVTDTGTCREEAVPSVSLCLASRVAKAGSGLGVRDIVFQQWLGLTLSSGSRRLDSLQLCVSLASLICCLSPPFSEAILTWCVLS